MRYIHRIMDLAFHFRGAIGLQFGGTILKEDAINNRDRLFEEREKLLSEKLDRLRKKSNQYSNVRMILFLSAIACGSVFWYLKMPAAAISGSAVLVLLFIGMVIFHTNLKKEIALGETLFSIQGEYRARIEHRFDLLPDSGDDFRDRNHDYSDDLDLFGRNSLFHLISIAQTWFGRRALAEIFNSAQKPVKLASEIVLRQLAVKEFSENLPMLQKFQAAGRLSRRSTEDPRKLLEYAKHTEGEKPLISFGYCILSLGITAAFIGSAILYFYGNLISQYVPLSIMLLQLVLVAFRYQKFKPAFSSVEDLYTELSAYSELFKEIERAEVSSEILTHTKRLLIDSEAANPLSASARVKKLHRICLFVQARSQPILFFILNVFFLYDNHCIYFLEKWKRESGSQLETYMHALGTWEALMSLSTLAIIYPECSFPTFAEASAASKSEQASFVSRTMGHPLIPIKKQVRNDFDLQHGIALITGSNMSGKTTLLRTIGINAVLAYAGTICCAEETCLGMMQIGSSMRIADDLGEGLSTFYAELLRIEKIIQKAKLGEPLLFLIDEIFRGTNSRDRTDGAIIVLKNLSNPCIIGLMSTHDYELCTLDRKSGVNLRYFHFSETYDEEGIHFDYRLTPGVSVSANARYLMRMIGIE